MPTISTKDILNAIRENNEYEILNGNNYNIFNENEISEILNGKENYEW